MNATHDPDQALFEEHTARIAELEKELANEKQAKEYWMRENQQHREVIAHVHHILDCVPYPPPKNDAANYPDGTEEWRYHNYTLIERFSTWLANCWLRNR